MQRFDRVLLPTAFSTLSKRASACVIPIAEKFGSEVHVVNIVPDAGLVIAGGTPDIGGGMPLPIPGPSADELLATSRRKLSEFVAEVLPSLGGRVRTHAGIGGIAEELVIYSEQHKIDLIIMGTHADGMLKRMVFGSIGKSVLESSRCPVLLVPVKDARD